MHAGSIVHPQLGVTEADLGHFAQGLEHLDWGIHGRVEGSEFPEQIPHTSVPRDNVRSQGGQSYTPNFN